jgi:hypothetical protein
MVLGASWVMHVVRPIILPSGFVLQLSKLAAAARYRLTRVTVTIKLLDFGLSLHAVDLHAT